MVIQKVKNNTKGFTLLEMMVAAAIFLLVIMAISGIYINIRKSNQTTQDYQDFLDNARFVMEFMAKEIRLGEIDYQRIRNESGYDGNPVDYIYFLNNKGQQSSFRKNIQSGCYVPFKKYESCITYQVDKEGGTMSTNITNRNIKIKRLDFYIIPEAEDNTKQPIVTIVLEVEPTKEGGYQLTRRLQTSVTSRVYD